MGQLSVATLNLKNPGTINRTNMLAEPGEVYASANNLYVATRHWWWWPAPGQNDMTYVHKFDITRARRGAATSRRARSTATSSTSSAMDEDDKGYFRVATTIDHRACPTPRTRENWWGRVETTNRVTVLGENERRSSRWSARPRTSPRASASCRAASSATRGYVVTFRQVDPLFTFDLCDPTNPRKVGELKVPGFSTLHPPARRGPPAHHRHLRAARTAELAGPRALQLSIFDVTRPRQPAADAHAAGGHRVRLAARRSTSTRRSTTSPPRSCSPFRSPTGARTPRRTTTGARFVSDLRVFGVDTADRLHRHGRGVDDGPVPACTTTTAGPTTGRRAVRRSVMADDFVYAISDAGIRVANIANLSAPIATTRFNKYEE